ncbi:hypothetical protein GQ53DRAFT_872355 [Thozetella sp. PMI_491]|nr:hypothetical protein GQ53DRAFT_872355 [Thozetella sp. PMI_491]
MQSSQDDIVGAWPPPDGVVPNFTNPESIAIHLILAAVICPLLTALFVGLRLFTSYFILKTWHADDILIVSALAFAIANSVLSIIRSPAQLGIVGSITYNLSTLFIKASILTMYLRFSIARALRIAIYLTMFVAVGYSLAGGFGFLYLCHPIPKLWDFSIPGSCGDFGVWYLSCAALNVATDALILLLPIWILWPMRVRFAQRLAVLGVLMAGGFVLGVSALRLSMMLEGLGSMDATWVYLPNLVWW